MCIGKEKVEIVSVNVQAGRGHRAVMTTATFMTEGKYAKH
jgi:hypothetical protein